MTFCKNIQFQWVSIWFFHGLLTRPLKAAGDFRGNGTHSTGGEREREPAWCGKPKVSDFMVWFPSFLKLEPLWGFTTWLFCTILVFSCSAPSHFLAMITPRWGSTCTWKSEQGGVWWVLKVESSISILCSASNLNSSGWTPPAAPSCRSLSMTYWILVASHDDTMQ